MPACIRVASVVAVAALAALPPIDGSFLVKGVIQKPQRPATPTVVVRQNSTSQTKPQVRCPMVTVEGDPKIDFKLAKTPPATVQFTIRAERPPCTTR